MNHLAALNWSYAFNPTPIGHLTPLRALRVRNPRGRHIAILFRCSCERSVTIRAKTIKTAKKSAHRHGVTYDPSCGCAGPPFIHPDGTRSYHSRYTAEQVIAHHKAQP